jgi:hypothetical protein
MSGSARMKSRTAAIWLFSEMNSKSEARRRACLAFVPARRVNHGVFVNQPQQRRPRRDVHGGNHLQRLARAPRRSGAALRRHLAAQCVQSDPRLAVVAPQPGQDADQLRRCVHRDVGMEHRPSDLEHADQVVGGGPLSRPVLQAKIADRGRRIRRLLRRQRPRLDRASDGDRVREIGELLASHEVAVVVSLACRLHVRLDAG